MLFFTLASGNLIIVLLFLVWNINNSKSKQRFLWTDIPWQMLAIQFVCADIWYNSPFFILCVLTGEENDLFLSPVCGDTLNISPKYSIALLCAYTYIVRKVFHKTLSQAQRKQLHYLELNQRLKLLQIAANLLSCWPCQNSIHLFFTLHKAQFWQIRTLL